MPNPRRLFRTLLLCLLAAVTLSGVVKALGDPNAPAAIPTGDPDLEIERPGQPAVKGHRKFTTVKLKMQHGEITLDLAHVHTLTVESTADGVRAAVEMADHSRLAGQLLEPLKELSVSVDGDDKTFPLEEGLKVKFVHHKEGGLIPALIGLFTLTVMEIVLGIDNIIFLAIVAGKLPESQQPLARRVGLGAALVTRLLLLCTLSFLLGLTRPLFIIPDLPFLHDPEARGVSWRDLILLVGGLFLVGKSVKEIHEKIETAAAPDAKPKKTAGFVSVIIQIAIIDIIFSLDSVITAVGMVDELWVMIAAVILAVGVMLAFAEPISKFVDKNPTIKLLALSFLILIGVLLVAEGLGQHVDKGYIYFAMGFAVVIELLNMKLRPKPKPKPAEVLPPTGV
jgi:predicted tellurium resistance membrane protein TerC